MTKQYQELEDGTWWVITPEKEYHVRKDHRYYDQMREEIEAGKAEILPYVEPVPTWQDNRIAAYGSWREQLDMMHHGTWKDHVAAVKAAHPKP